MKRFSLIVPVLLFFFYASVHAQNTAAASDETIASKIKNYEDEHSQAMEILSYVSDVYGPRLNYSPEYREAADWVSKKLNEWGIEDIHYENWAPVGKGWSLKSFYAEITSPRTIPLIAYPKAWSPGFKGVEKADVIYLNAESPKDLEGYKGKLKGKFVMISQPADVKPHFNAPATRLTDSALLKLSNAFETRGRQRMRFPRLTMDNFDSALVFLRRYIPDLDSARLRNIIIDREVGAKKLKLCQDEGALAVISVSNGDDGTIFVQQAQVPQEGAGRGVRRVNAYDPDAPAIVPQVVVSSEQYNRMARMIEKGEKLRMEMGLNVAWTKADSSFNIIGEIPGTDLKDEVVLIGGHFDSWHSGTGATDNSSGTAVCMEAMRILKALNITPRRTIRIGLWGGEEEGLIGSRKYVERNLAKAEEGNSPAAMGSNAQASYETTPAFDNFSVYFNDDNGGGRFRGIYLQGNEAARPIFREWLHEFDDPEAQTISISNTGGTDHLSFDAAGLPAFQFIQDPMDYGVRTHHTNMDVYERIVEKDLKQSAAMMAFFAYKAAMADSKIPRKEKKVNQQVTD